MTLPSRLDCIATSAKHCLMQMVAALPAGWWADKDSQVLSLRLASSLNNNLHASYIGTASSWPVSGDLAANQLAQPCCLQMVAALPAGWLADKYRRDRILKAAAVLGALAGVGLAVTLVDALPIKALFAATALLGCYTGFNNAPLEALFSDCIPRGRRYTHTHTCDASFRMLVLL